MGRPLFAAANTTAHVTNCPCSICNSRSGVAEPDTSVSHPQQVAREAPNTIPLSFVHPSSSSTVSRIPLVLHNIAQTQALLLQTSSTIEATFQRLIDIHNTTQRILEGMSTDSRDGATRMGPNHSAIVLSQPGSESGINPTSNVYSTDNVESSMALVPVSTPSPLEQLSSVAEADVHVQVPSRTRERNLTGRTPVAVSIVARTSSQALNRSVSPSVLYGPRPEPPSMGHLSRRSMVASYMLSRRDSDPSDPSTSLGRRIAAMTSAASRESPNSIPSSARSTDEANDRIMEIASNIDRAIQRLNQHRSELVAAATNLRGFSRGETAGLTTESDITHSPDTQPTSGGVRNTSLGASQPDTTPHEPSHTVRTASGAMFILRYNRPTGQIPDASTNADTVVTGNHQYMDRGPSATRERRGGEEGLPALVSDDEGDPYAWLMPDTRSRPTLNTSSTYTRDAVVDPAQPSSNAISQDDLQNPSTSLDRPISWVLAPLPPEEREEIRTRDDRFRRRLQAILRPATSESSMAPRQPSTNGSRRRRRGWARLDLNGNEIPTDEEEEYERNRAHMRARAQAITLRSAGAILVDSHYPSTEASTLPPPPPEWLNIPTPPMRVDDNSSTGARIQRSFSNVSSHDPRSVLAGQIRRSRTEMTPYIHEYHHPVPFRVSTLPWKSVELAPSSGSRLQKRKSSSSHSPPRVLEQSPFAGR